MPEDIAQDRHDRLRVAVIPKFTVITQWSVTPAPTA